MKVTIDWLGVATFRLTLGETVVFLDAYMDRVPSAPPVGLSAMDVERADFILVGHSHFDHLAGADLIAKNTRARVIGSNETCRVLRDQDVPKEQLLRSQGGERHRLAPDVTVRVFPGLHSCTWCAGTVALDEDMSGHEGLTEDERAAVAGGLVEQITRAATVGDAARELREHIGNAVGSGDSGGALVYLIETPQGSILFQDTSGCWSGVLRDLRPDVAILAAAGRGNLDGEPFQGSLAQFIAQEALWLQAGTVIVCHHDNWLPPVTRDTTDVTPVREALARTAPKTKLLEMGYLEGMELLS